MDRFVPHIKSPILYLWGGKDRIVPHSDFTTLPGITKAPHEVKIYPNEAHLVFHKPGQLNERNDDALKFILKVMPQN